MNLIGRTEETNILEKLYQSHSAEFLALYGRRRIGKTFLIREYFKSKKNTSFFNVTGAKNAPMKEQIRHFTDQISETFYKGIKLQAEKNWDNAFDQLTKTMREQVPKNKKIVLFFDELPWMATPRSRILEMLDYYWNQYWSQDSRIKLIVCGSSASWIIRNIIHHKGGLHNRITREIHLEPYHLQQTKAFLHKRNIKLSHRQILQIYMVTGGIPFYLSKIEKGLSASQTIESLAFSNGAFLLDEFDKLFSSLFDNSEDYLSIVKLLAKHRDGIGERTLLEAVGKRTIGAKGKKILNDLEQTGFIMSFKPLYHLKKGTYYRLIDEYVLFYLKWIEPVKNTLTKKSLGAHYWQDIQTTPEWHSWQGYAFEAICYKHLVNIRTALQLSPRALPSTWRYAPHKHSAHEGAQIDLLFDRNDDAITICEIKYTEKPFTLTKEYTASLLKKVKVFKERTLTSKQIFISLIAANGVNHNMYTDEHIATIITLDDLFR